MSKKLTAYFSASGVTAKAASFRGNRYELKTKANHY
jgi:hypothetical protein